MPIGSFKLSPVTPGLTPLALPLMVCRYAPGPDGTGGGYSLLPNIRCSQIAEKEGIPTVASFEYLIGDNLQINFGWPSNYEKIFPINSQGPYTVQSDDRIAVLGILPSGTLIVLFDGYAQIPEIGVSESDQSVTFTAVSVEIRLWDDPVSDRLQRDGDQAGDTTATYDRRIGLPCRFNPSDGLRGYLGNCVATSDDYTVNPDVGNYPVFIDPLLSEAEEAGVNLTSLWYVSDGIIYLIAEMQIVRRWDYYVKFPTLSSLATLLQCQSPPRGSQTVNSGNAVATDISIRDYDATNKAYPDVIKELLAYAGFVLRFRTDTTAAGFPQHTMVISRRDNLSTIAPKSFYHAAASTATINPAANNAQRYRLVRDANVICNEYTVETSPKQVEATFLLAPLFQPAKADATDPKPFLKPNLTNATEDQRRAYRWYGVDECGFGYWDATQGKWITGQGCDFSVLWPLARDVEDGGNGAGTPTYVRRFRPGLHRLISKDAEGKPLKSVLEVQFGVKSAAPGPLQGPGVAANWLTISHGWQLLDDRLGIEVTIDNPEQWSTGNGAVKKINGISWVANPTGMISINDKQMSPYFSLRLTTVIDGDQLIRGTRAARRFASPTQFARRRRADAQDHFQYRWVALNSLYYLADGGNGADPVVVRDDTAAAITHGEQLRSKTEMPSLSGSITVPYITGFVEIGDRIDKIIGRNASLQTSVGGDQGEAPSYGWVVGRTWRFTKSSQFTDFALTDHRAEGTHL